MSSGSPNVAKGSESLDRGCEQEKEQSEELCASTIVAPPSPQISSLDNPETGEDPESSLRSQLQSLALKVSPETQEEIAKVLESMKDVPKSSEEIFKKSSLLSRRSLTPETPDEGHSSWIVGVGHLITVIIGAGVLSLPKAFSLLGWIFGPILLIFFGVVSLWTSYMLAQVHEVDGKKLKTYKHAVFCILGAGHRNTLATVLYIKMYMNAINYTISGAISMQFIANTACKWQGSTTCTMSGIWAMTGIFSCLQLFLNILPNLESIWWVSIIGALMSYAYSSIALALSIWSISIYGVSRTTSLFGKGDATQFKAAMSIFQAFGNVAYAWSCAALVHSIQSTLKEPPKSEKSMAKTINASFSTTVVFYLSVACTGYAALGDSAPGDVLVGFNVSDVVEVIANVTVLLHMISVVQVYTQPLFEAFENDVMARYTPSLITGPKKLLVRFIYRGISTAVITAVGASVPYFSLFGGLIGSVSYWPLQVFYPMMMHSTVYPPSLRARMAMYFVGTVMLGVCSVATIGSIYGMAVATEGSGH